MTRIEEPFVMIRKEKDGIPLTGNSRFEVYFRFRHFSLRRMKKKKRIIFLKNVGNQRIYFLKKHLCIVMQKKRTLHFWPCNFTNISKYIHILQTLQGFCLDLLEQMSDQVGFKYVLELVPDNNYGAMNITSGEWNGLVKGM